ncbi:TNF receptor-associated factor homolog 1a-like isoform X1 [Typha angustifolia]|uniref:TNF receptor-associated factor homolog 1a-like isoform X1 n=1 Tax=Typha angustifolia TaxID=59011 RepID=UPI003C2C1475
MAGTLTEDCEMGGRSSPVESMSNEERYPSGDSLAEWRSSEQVENGTPSTSPPYWDIDDEDDCGPKPSELFGRFTWKVENFAETNKRELRSNAFEVGGYKWYILIYPQGCDVCNHLSLFLCVANHDKLLPGWSHFAQFTIAVVNKDPKKSKYSDTLHRFWKKEHDWGWKKFMELSKVYDGFVVDNTLIIKAQVQVIREKAHRPFRCLDCQYRRELVRIYLSNVEQICRRFVEERRSKLGKLIEDKVRWSSFRAFWLGIDPSARRRMSRDKTDSILKVVVKHFFIEKEVTSTLVMDSLYSGLMALECQSKTKKVRAKLMDMQELPAPMVRVEKDMFVLADDVVMLLERAVSEPLPHQPLPSKDEKCSQNRTKDGSSSEELNKDSIERDERRLTELGRRTVEIFVLAHIFSSRIEVAYQEAVALKRQEELIREEEAAGLAESELKGKRAAEKEKRAKKKQSKQKRNSRKGKDKGRSEKSDAIVQEKIREESPDDRIMVDFHSNQAEPMTVKVGAPEEDESDGSENADVAVEVLQLDLDDRDSSPTNWETDVSEIHPAMEASGVERQNGQTGKGSSFMDDSSSTCSTDSVPSVVMNWPYKGNIIANNKVQTSPNRGKNQRSETNNRTGVTHAGSYLPSDGAIYSGRNVSGNFRATGDESDADVLSLKDRIQSPEKHVIEKEEVVFLQKKVNAKDQVEAVAPSKPLAESSSLPLSPVKKPPSILQQSKQTLESSSTTRAATTIAAAATSTTASGITIGTVANMAELVSSKEQMSSGRTQTEKSVFLASRSPPVSSTSISEAQKQATSSKSTTTSQVTAMSRPSSAPLIPAARPATPVVSTVEVMPLLSRSMSVAGRLGNDPSSSAPSYVPQSYRNAIMGKANVGASTSSFTHHSTSFSQGAAITQSASAFVSSASMLPRQTSAWKDQTSVRPGFTFGSVKPEALNNQHSWRDDYSRQEASSSNGRRFSSSTGSGIERLDMYGDLQTKQFTGEIPASFTSYQSQGMVGEEFPHLDIINDLLDEEQHNTAKSLHYNQHVFNRQYSLPGNLSKSDIGLVSGACRFDQDEPYYDEGLSRVYGSSIGPLHGLRDGNFPQVDLSAYANSQVDGILQNQWSYVRPDLSMLNLGNDVNGYSYQLGDYSNLTTALNGYSSMYRPANGP